LRRSAAKLRELGERYVHVAAEKKNTSPVAEEKCAEAIHHAKMSSSNVVFPATVVQGEPIV